MKEKYKRMTLDEKRAERDRLSAIRASSESCPFTGYFVNPKEVEELSEDISDLTGDLQVLSL